MSVSISGGNASFPQSAGSSVPPAVDSEPRGRDVVRLEGEIDQLSVTAAADTIFSRLDEAAGPLVVDLSAVSFLCVDGLRILAQAADRATLLGIELRVVSGGARAVERGLRAAQLEHLLADDSSSDSTTAQNGSTAVAGGPRG
ncbi:MULTISPECIES: STAS domain-containing protein [Prauserella salsuginis group]|uniref:STAS domain-containing protein n=1 Tax=Prauserella salsuginis TaxID=387889 RepID=A0ABW6G216_9PSEU|nr:MULTISPECIES: STAS domain-containing protein [Prauserella salsuginis group]MCR3719984.1 anti-anti-sigma factor [Prauserella flava]MCR3736472.1 anti-anti-sigma factor [Prauserella salsuginis]